jgi:hypothetical protein
MAHTLTITGTASELQGVGRLDGRACSWGARCGLSGETGKVEIEREGALIVQLLTLRFVAKRIAPVAAARLRSRSARRGCPGYRLIVIYELSLAAEAAAGWPTAIQRIGAFERR